MVNNYRKKQVIILRTCFRCDTLNALVFVKFQRISYSMKQNHSCETNNPADKKIPSLLETRRFIILFTTACHQSAILSQMNPVNILMPSLG